MLNPLNIFISFVFGLIGFVAFIYGKKNQHISSLMIGFTMMVYPYFIPQTWLNLLIGSILCAALYFVSRL